jgi:hypothetical protein
VRRETQSSRAVTVVVEALQVADHHPASVDDAP